jgi:drug/metabolite transporter (DMT)-like permease
MTDPAPRAKSWSAELAALLTVTIWGTSFALQKVALTQFNVLVFMSLRYLGMLILSWTVLFWWCRSKGGGIAVKRGDLPGMALTGVLGYTFYIPLSTLGLSYTTAFSNALLIATAPLFAALLLRALRLEAIGPRHCAGMLLSLLGVALFVLPVMRGSVAGTGDLISLAAALFFAGYSVASKPLVSRYPPLVVTAYTLTFGAIPVILCTLPSVLGQDWIRVTPAGWEAFAWTVVVPVYVAWSIWSWTIARVGVGRASLFMYLVPIVGGVASWFVLGEEFGVVKIAGAALTLAGLLIGRRTEASPALAPSVALAAGRRIANSVAARAAGR